jgi:4-amino-4-deoxy-L-arabinose transferase-like glycosyltransferase
LRGYTGMHAALAMGFLCKSAAAWMVPALTFLTLIIWERRWRELLRWEVYVGLLIQAVCVLTWVWFVYVGPDGPGHLKVFFWNNLAGRFAHVDAPEALQYAAAHKNSPGKYLVEMPVYLWPWTLLVLAAIRRAWQQRRALRDELRAVRFACATFLPTLLVLSAAATARNIYLAPAFPGIALLLGWWASRLPGTDDAWDSRAVRTTAGLLLVATLVLGVAVVVTGMDSWEALDSRLVFAAVSATGLIIGAWLAIRAWRDARRTRWLRAAFAMVLAYCALLAGPASQIYGRVDTWQDLAKIGAAIGQDTQGRPLILFTPDETTRAFIDMYTGPVWLIPTPATPVSGQLLQERLALAPDAVVVAQMPGQVRSRVLAELATRLGLSRGTAPVNPAAEVAPAWAVAAGLHLVRLYALPNGRRYALFGGRSIASR